MQLNWAWFSVVYAALVNADSLYKVRRGVIIVLMDLLTTKFNYAKIKDVIQQSTTFPQDWEVQLLSRNMIEILRYQLLLLI